MSIDWAEKSSPPIDNGKGAKCVRALLVLLKNTGIIGEERKCPFGWQPFVFCFVLLGQYGPSGLLGSSKRNPGKFGV